MLDDRTATTDAHFVWNIGANRFGWSAYLGGGDPPPYAVPARRADLTGLPPAWIGVGDIDLFHEENRAYADRLTAAGVDTTLRVEPGAPHGFEGWAPTTPVARDFVAEAREWLGRSLRAG